MEMFYITWIIFLIVACTWYMCLFEIEERSNVKLQEENEMLLVKYAHMKVRLKKKKELLETQDKLIKDLETDNISLDVALDIVIEQRNDLRDSRKQQ